MKSEFDHKMFHTRPQHQKNMKKTPIDIENVGKCFIMQCSLNTEFECLQLNLFGAFSSQYDQLKKVDIGDIGFLYNTHTEVLIGVFVAQSRAQSNIIPSAWNGKFPVQVKVRLLGKEKRLNNALDIFKQIGLKIKILRSGNKAPAFFIYDKKYTQDLLVRFSSIDTVRRVEMDKEKEDGYSKHSTTLGQENGQDLLIEDQITYETVIGLTDVKEFIKKRMVDPLLNLDEAQKYHLRLGGGLLLYGPPGTGKTLLAQATASEIDADFIEINPSIIHGYPGDPETRIGALFDKLTSGSRTVVFIDEAEALLADRENQSSTVMQRITPFLLSQFNKLARDRFLPVLVIAATNMPWKIDRAFLRPGRLGKSIYVGLPDEQDRAQMLKMLIGKRSKDRVSDELFNNETLQEIAKKLGGFSFADIVQIFDYAAHEAFMRKESISEQFLYEEINNWSKSVSQEQILEYKNWEKKNIGYKIIQK
jgi:SpoVK/Ycf46/Vps4 family AAA+-type ATPase